MKLPWQHKWLIVFIDDGTSDETTFRRNVIRLQESLTARTPVFETLLLDGSALKKMGSTVGADMELTEEFSAALLDEVIRKRKESRANRLAVVLRRGQFGSEEAFVAAVRDTYFDDERRYMICARSDFLTLRKKMDCLNISCKECK